MFKLADLVEDAEIFEIANEDAEEIMNSKNYSYYQNISIYSNKLRKTIK